MTSLSELTDEIVSFRNARDWQQFHTPRNLAAATAIEAGELQEVLLWKTDENAKQFLQTPEGLQAISHELADVLIFALLLCHEAGVDPVKAISGKLQVNAQKYPVADSKGKADKYDRLKSP